MILFICKANVGRSQIAEALYNRKYGAGDSLSIAGCEARKEKYSGIPDQSIIEFMRDDIGMDISSQRIKYLTDLKPEDIERIEATVYLYHPIKNPLCDNKCLLFGKTPYEYLLSRGIPVEIYEVEDPFEIGKIGYANIYQDILEIIGKIS